MIIYNVTCSVDGSVVEDWLSWIREDHIPAVLETGLFIRATINRVLSEEDNQYTYAIKYYCVNLSLLQDYERIHANQLREDHLRRYGDKVLSFRTVLREIDSFNGLA